MCSYGDDGLDPLMMSHGTLPCNFRHNLTHVLHSARAIAAAEAERALSTSSSSSTTAKGRSTLIEDRAAACITKEEFVEIANAKLATLRRPKQVDPKVRLVPESVWEANPFFFCV
jgi:hypothetical protein